MMKLLFIILMFSVKKLNNIEGEVEKKESP